MNCRQDNRKILNSWERVKAVYIHIPFCIRKCLYCNFVSYANCNNLMTAYCRSLCNEISARASEADIVEEEATIYFGGGTPSILPIECLEAIVSALKKYGFWKCAPEVTIEANPGTVNKEKLNSFLRLGFSRISIGVQSLNDYELDAIGRVHTGAQALESLELARSTGFKNINADLIYGLPRQSITSLKVTLAKLLEEKLEHISVYGLSVEEDTELYSKLCRRELVLPDDDNVEDMYFLVQKMLKDADYERYEISNYAAQKGYQSKHNTAYWRYFPYLGFGAAACGFDGQNRRTATGSLQDYIKLAQEITANTWLDSNLYQLEALDRNTRLAEFMFMGLRRSCGVSIDEIKERFNVDIMDSYGKALDSCFKNGLVFWDYQKRRIRLTEQGMALGNIVFEIFVT